MSTLKITALPLDPDLIPQRLPQGWKLFNPLCDEYQAVWRGPKGMGVIMSVTRELDGRRWLHASLSAKTINDAYEKLALLKRIWIGEDRTALQVFPPRSKHVNVHPNCLHLWACLDEDVTPDFTRGLGIV